MKIYCENNVPQGCCSILLKIEKGTVLTIAPVILHTLGSPNSVVIIITSCIRLFFYFSLVFLFQLRTCFHRLFHAVLQELVQILVWQVVRRLVRHAPALPSDLLRCLPTRVIVVQETADMPVAFQHVQRPGQVADRVEHYAVRHRLSLFERKIREIIHETLKNQHRRLSVPLLPMPEMRDILWGGRTLEMRVAYLQSALPVPEPDPEIPFAAHAVMHLHTLPRGDAGRNPPVCQVAQQHHVAERREAQLLECRRRGGRLPGCRSGREHGEVSLYALQYGGYVARPVQPLRQVDDAASRPLAEVDSQVSGKTDLE